MVSAVLTKEPASQQEGEQASNPAEGAELREGSGAREEKRCTIMEDRSKQDKGGGPLVGEVPCRAERASKRGHPGPGIRGDRPWLQPWQGASSNSNQQQASHERVTATVQYSAVLAVLGQRCLECQASAPGRSERGLHHDRDMISRAPVPNGARYQGRQHHRPDVATRGNRQHQGTKK